MIYYLKTTIFLLLSFILCGHLDASVTVSNTSDTVNGDTSSVAALIANNGGDGISLREAVIATNNDATENIINIGVAGSIGLLTDLSVTGTDTVIDGTGVAITISSRSLNISSPNFVVRECRFSGTSNQIRISGAGYGLIENSIFRNYNGAVRLETTTSQTITIRACYFGSDPDFLDSNLSGPGVWISNAPNATIVIGGTNAADKNYFVWHDGLADDSGIFANGTFGTLTVLNNYFGTNENGDDLSNYRSIYFQGGQWTQATIGAPNQGNVFGHSNQAFVNNSQTIASPIKLQGNYVGTDSLWRDLGHFSHGFVFQQEANVIVGGVNPGEGNYFGFNALENINPQGAVTFNGFFGTGVVQGNYIGTNPNGDDLGNCVGVHLSNFSGNVTIGGSTAAAANTIAYSVDAEILGSGGACTIQGNYLGTNSNGASYSSVKHIQYSSGSTLIIGGDAPGEGNTFGNATSESINLRGGHTTFSLQGNYIGTNASGADLGNNVGIKVENTVSNKIIGSVDPSVDNSGANTFAFNDTHAIVLDGATVSDIQFRGNSIHSNDVGAISLLNGSNGGIAAPTLTDAMNGTVVGSGAEANAIIDVYQNPTPETQARTYIGSGVADAAGDFNFTVSGMLHDHNITVTQTNATGSSSSLSNVVTSVFIVAAIVNNTNDLINGDTSSVTALVINDGGDGISLREAITAVNNDPSNYDIEFDTGVFPLATPATINPTSALPIIVKDNLVFDATSAGVIIDGTGLSAGIDGLKVNAESVTIQGLIVTEFDNAIELIGGSNHLVGGDLDAERNFLWKSNRGVLISTPGTNIRVVNNYVGTDIACADLGNTYGIVKTAAAGSGTIIKDNVVGWSDSNGLVPIQDYEIHDSSQQTGSSGPAYAQYQAVQYRKIAGIGIHINGGEALLIGNYVGVDPTGCDIGNYYGIQVNASGSKLTDIGDSTSLGANVVGFNDTAVYGLGASAGGNVSIKGNYIGTDTSFADYGNKKGIHLNSNLTSFIIGGPSVNERNFIGYQAGFGVRLTGKTSTVENNFIGVTNAGADMGNNKGIRIQTGSSGGVHTITGNTIGFSNNEGIEFITGAAIIQSNFIGVMSDNTPIANATHGIHIEGNVPGTLIGSSDPSNNNSFANTIAFNGGSGVRLESVAASSVTVRGNSFFSNTGFPIELIGSANESISPPVVDQVIKDYVSITGAVPNASLDLFLNPNPGDEARIYLASGVADASGNLTVFAQGVDVGDIITLNQTNANSSSSGLAISTASVEFGIQMGRVLSDGSITITGTGIPGVEVRLIINGVVVATAIPDAQGNWSITTNVLPYGAHEFIIETTTSVGVLSDTQAVLYNGRARVFEFERHYRNTGFTRNLELELLLDALADFETNIDLNDGDDFELHQHDSANNIDQIDREGVVSTLTENNMNETEQIGSFRTNIVYDDLGRMTSYTETVDSVTTYYELDWNMRDQLVEVRNSPDGTNFTVVSNYEYYPDGMRSVKRINGGSTEVYYGVNMMIHEVYSLSGTTETLEKEFCYESIDRPTVMFTDADGNAGTGALGGREAYFYHCNPRGDVYALSAGEAVTVNGNAYAEGEIVERYDYSLYGDTYVMDASYQLIDENGNPVTEQGDSKSAIGNPFQWGGAWKDDETCFMWMRHRYYDSRMRGFLSRDPAEDDSLGNLYAFTGGNPGTYSDPLGLFGTRTDAGPDNTEWFQIDVRGTGRSPFRYADVGQVGTTIMGDRYVGIQDPVSGRVIRVEFEAAEEMFRYMPSVANMSPGQADALLAKQFAILDALNNDRGGRGFPITLDDYDAYLKKKGMPSRRKMMMQMWSGVLDATQDDLEVAGRVPYVGDVADVANATMSAARGNFRDATERIVIGLFVAGGMYSMRMLGEFGTQLMSQTVYRQNMGKSVMRIDVENPAPGKRPGQIHVQLGDEKWMYDVENNAIIGAPNRVKNMLENDAGFQDGIQKALRYLGEDQR